MATRPIRATGVLLVLLLLVLGCANGAPSSFDQAVTPAIHPPSPPPPTAPGELRVTAAGDYGQEPTTAALLEAVGTSDTAAHFALGDLSYGEPGGEQEWCDFVRERVGEQLPFQLLAGNHEADGEDGHIDEFAECLPNRLPGVVGEYAREYYVDLPAKRPLARFVLISPGIDFGDGEWDYSEGTDHHEWVRRAIVGAREAGIPWTVVGMHMSCISLGVHGCEVPLDLFDLLLEEGVPLVLNAHEHSYMRTVPLTGDDDCTLEPRSFDDDCTGPAGDQVEADSGTVVVTAGTGGTRLREIDTSRPEADYFAAASGANDNGTYGFLRLDIDEEEVAVTFESVAGGDFADAFTILR